MKKYKFKDCYVVKFNLQKEDGYWEYGKLEDIMVPNNGSGKNLHKKAEEIFRQNYKGENFEIVSVSYV